MAWCFPIIDVAVTGFATVNASSQKSTKTVACDLWQAGMSGIEGEGAVGKVRSSTVERMGLYASLSLVVVQACNAIAYAQKE
jgi:hypothetical protein